MKIARLAIVAALGLAACEEPSPVVPPQPPAEPPPAATAAPADPAPVVEGDVTDATVSGMRVLVKRIPHAELTATQLYIRGGVRNWSAEDAGVERLALAVATAGGTESLDKDAFARRLASLGSEIGSDSGADYAEVLGKSLTAKWDETFALLVDAFLHPALPATEIDLQKQRQLTAIRQEHDNPDAMLRVLLNRALFRGHPYSKRSIGTAESVGKLTADALKAHLAKLREAGRLVLVVAGDVDPAHVIEKAKAAFGALPRGSYDGAAIPKVSFEKAAVMVEQKKLPTNYILGAFPAPGWSDGDYADALVATSHLSHRLFEEVRTKRNLSYAPSARLMSGLSVPLGSLYVTAVDPNTTMRVMYDEVKKLQATPMSEKELAGTKATFLTHHLMAEESTDGQASELAHALLLGGDWRLGRALPERIRAVTAEGVQAYAKKYMGRIQTVVVGDPDKIDKSLFTSM